MKRSKIKKLKRKLPSNKKTDCMIGMFQKKDQKRYFNLVKNHLQNFVDHT